jgi:hypothetical protein
MFSQARRPAPWILAVAATAQLACGGDGAEGDTEAGSTGTELFACMYESRLLDSCNNPGGSAWIPGCVDVRSEEACTMLTAESTEQVGDCEFTRDYRNVETQPGMVCPEVESTGPSPNEGAEIGEECTVLSDCAAGICIPEFYCTVACSDASDCETAFPSGCCVSQGSLGYCIAADDCAALCPDNASPVGLPTVCTCDEGFDWNADFTMCEPT